MVTYHIHYPCTASRWFACRSGLQHRPAQTRLVCSTFMALGASLSKLNSRRQHVLYKFLRSHCRVSGFCSCHVRINHCALLCTYFSHGRRTLFAQFIVAVRGLMNAKYRHCKAVVGTLLGGSRWSRDSGSGSRSKVMQGPWYREWCFGAQYSIVSLYVFFYGTLKNNIGNHLA